MRDMHDGVGGQLVQALALVESSDQGGRLHESIPAVLDDSGLLIDASGIHS